MSTTFGALKTEVSAAIRDPDGKTFDTTAVGRLINSALSEVGRVLPRQFQEDITPVEDELDYIVLSDDFAAEANPDIEVARVEVWDGSQTPPRRVTLVEPASSGFATDSQSGWTLWGGTLSIPNYIFAYVDGHEADYLYRVWGYSPYPAPDSDDDVIDVSTDAYWAVVAAAKVEAIDRLVGDRTLFTQWQTRSGNSDISPAGLMNELTYARDDWRRKKRELLRLRASI